MYDIFLVVMEKGNALLQLSKQRQAANNNGADGISVVSNIPRHACLETTIHPFVWCRKIQPVQRGHPLQ